MTRRNQMEADIAEAMRFKHDPPKSLCGRHDGPRPVPACCLCGKTPGSERGYDREGRMICAKCFYTGLEVSPATRQAFEEAQAGWQATASEPSAKLSTSKIHEIRLDTPKSVPSTPAA